MPVTHDGKRGDGAAIRRSASTCIQRTPTTEAAIQPGITRDLYVSLGEEGAAQHLDGGAST